MRDWKGVPPLFFFLILLHKALRTPSPHPSASCRTLWIQHSVCACVWVSACVQLTWAAPGMPILGQASRSRPPPLPSTPPAFSQDFFSVWVILASDILTLQNRWVLGYMPRPQRRVGDDGMLPACRRILCPLSPPPPGRWITSLTLFSKNFRLRPGLYRQYFTHSRTQWASSRALRCLSPERFFRMSADGLVGVCTKRKRPAYTYVCASSWPTGVGAVVVVVVVQGALFV